MAKDAPNTPAVTPAAPADNTGGVTGSWDDASPTARFVHEAATAAVGAAKSAAGMGKEILFPEGDTEVAKIKDIAKKLIIDPAARMEMKAQTAKTSAESIGYSIAEGIPLIGPYAADVAEQTGKQAGGGDYAGAAGTVFGNVLAAHVIGKAAEPLGEAAKTGAEKVVSHAGELAKTTLESAGEGAQKIVAATAPEGSLEAGFAKLGGKKVRGATPKPAAEPEPEKFAEVGGKFVGKAPEAPEAPKPTEYHPDLQKVIDLPGVKVHQDPSQVTDAAHFVTPDGKFVRLPAGMDHDKAIAQVTGQDVNTEDVRPNFLNNTEAIRIRPMTDKAGTTLHVNVPREGVTPEQVDALKQAIGQGMKGQGHLLLETADNPQNIKMTEKDFVRPADVEPMLKEIGAHPDSENQASDVTSGPEHLDIPPERLRVGGTKQETITHEVGHAVVGHTLGWTPIEIQSHLHPAIGPTGAAASTLMDNTTLGADADGYISDDDLRKAYESQMAPTLMAGGVAQLIHHGIPIEENEGLRGDLEYINEIGKQLGYSDAEIQRVVKTATAKAHDILTRPTNHDILSRYAAARTEGLSKTLHMDTKTMQQLTAEVSKQGEPDAQANQNPPKGDHRSNRKSNNRSTKTTQ